MDLSLKEEAVYRRQIQELHKRLEHDTLSLEERRELGRELRQILALLEQETVTASLAKTRLIITDVDGVLTDGSLYYGAEGEVLKRFHARDGLGIRLLQRIGVQIAVVSGRDCPALRRRLSELDIVHIRLGRLDKASLCRELMEKIGVTAEETVYVGDDLVDVVAFRTCGLGIAVADAPAYVKKLAGYVLETKGGEGAFRELADRILFAQGYKDFFAPEQDFGLSRMDGKKSLQ